MKQATCRHLFPIPDSMEDKTYLLPSVAPPNLINFTAPKDTWKYPDFSNLIQQST